MDEENLEFELTSESHATPSLPFTRTHQGDADLIVAMRAGRSRAMRAFYVRFRPVLLDQACRLGVPHQQREETVADFLADIVLALVEMATTPRSVAAYVITAFRRCVFYRFRQSERDDARTQEIHEVFVSAPHTPDPMGAEEPESPAVTIALQHLADHLVAQVGEHDRELLTWLGEHVPMRVMAVWRGVTENAMKVKVSRMRARLRAETAKYLSETDAETQRELTRFFERAGVVLPAAAVPTITSWDVPKLNALRVQTHLQTSETAPMEYLSPSPYGPEAE